MASQWEDFYATHLPPSDFEDNRSLLKEFCERHNKFGRRIVLVTVAMIITENSKITRICFSLEVQPFLQNITQFDLLTILVLEIEEQLQQNTSWNMIIPLYFCTEPSLWNLLLDILMDRNLWICSLSKTVVQTQPYQVMAIKKFTLLFIIQCFSVKPDNVDVLAPILESYKTVQEGGRILYITFTTLSDYFWLLRAACECLTIFGNRALLYLAAAVSDFYIPSSEIVSLKYLLEVVHLSYCFAAYSQNTIGSWSS